jgi:quercetin dioxygenase-like cupin family protein
MAISFHHSKGKDPSVAIPAIGLDLQVRIPTSATDGAFCLIETTNAPGFGPPLHRHVEAEVFRVMSGRYLYEVDGRRFHAETGDVVSVPGGSAHAFINVTDQPAKQFIMITPGLDALAFFSALANVMRNGRPDVAALNAFGRQWAMEFLGPPLQR